MNTFKKIINFLLLNILWVVCSLPLVTLGTSTCAAFYVSLKMVNGEEVQVIPMFFKAFKQDFMQGLLMLCVTSPCAALGLFMWRYILNSDDKNILIIAGAVIVSFILIVINFYSYPLIARYSNTLKNTIRNSAGITVQHFKTTLLTIVVVAAEIGVMLMVPVVRLAGIFFIPELVIYTISKTAKPIFQQIESTPGPSGEESDSSEESELQDKED